MAPKPQVLIFGGVNTYSRSLAAFLLPLDGEPLVSHLRIVDKFSVVPATTYIGPEFPKILEKPEVEYRQVNLTVESNIPSTFDPPSGQPAYDYVFDLTGEVRPDRSAEIQINTTCNVARFIATEAAKRKVKAYVRLQQPFYATSSTKGPRSEPDEVKPYHTHGIWWHETLRILANMPDLNLVILRVGLVYGPYVDYGELVHGYTHAAVYGYLKKPLKSMWAPGKHPTNTLHVTDAALGLWKCAEWMAPLGRAAANAAAGERIAFLNEKPKIKDVEGAPPADAQLTAPLFNLVDDSQATYSDVFGVLTDAFGTTLEWFNLVESLFVKVGSLLLSDDVVEEINEEHMTAWTEMITTSSPPVPNTPISAYLDKYEIDKHVVGFTNDKIKRVMDISLKHPHLNKEVILDIIDKWKSEGIWPNNEPKP